MQGIFGFDTRLRLRLCFRTILVSHALLAAAGLPADLFRFGFIGRVAAKLCAQGCIGGI